MHSHGSHHHEHSHAHTGVTARALRISLIFTVAYIVLLVIAGIRAHSLALLSEAGHNVSDFLALLLSWLAVYLEERPPSATKTYGYQRAGVLAAFVNAGSLVLISLLIFYEAFQRFSHPEAVHAGTMMWVAATGVILNGAIALLLLRSRRDLNLRSALIHEIGDTLSTAAVIVGGWVILVTGYEWIDPALSVVIGLLILWSSIGIIRESLNILLEGTPRGINPDKIEAELKQIPGVLGVHHLHVWSLGSEAHALSSHIEIGDVALSESTVIMTEIKHRLAEKFHIDHTTIQFEHVACEATNGCAIPQSTPWQGK